jgi:polyvinyl alcohol dehydrogenase (cytochrome)
LAVANGIVYAPSLAGSATAPNMFALNATTGAKLWSFPAGSSVNAGAAIVGGVVYWGSGYARSSGATGGKDKFYAFSENGK